MSVYISNYIAHGKIDRFIVCSLPLKLDVLLTWKCLFKPRTCLEIEFTEIKCGLRTHDDRRSCLGESFQRLFATFICSDLTFGLILCGSGPLVGMCFQSRPPWKRGYPTKFEFMNADGQFLLTVQP